jgi:hypothetical protein
MPHINRPNTPESSQWPRSLAFRGFAYGGFGNQLDSLLLN